MVFRTLLLASTLLFFLSCHNESGTDADEATQAAAQEEVQTAEPAATQPQDSAKTGEAPGGQIPSGHPPIGPATAPMSLPTVPPGSGTGATALTWTPPPGWIEETPTSSMRRAQYRASGPGGDGQCVVFYFGPGEGGDAMGNAQRWASQFKQPDGRPSSEVLKTETIEVNGTPVLMTEITGIYLGGMAMRGGPAKESPNSMLLGAIAQGSDANWFFKFTGPEATLQAQKEAFHGMIRSLKPGD